MITYERQSARSRKKANEPNTTKGDKQYEKNKL